MSWLNDNLQALAIALGLGLLVGLQRQRAASLLAGIRTFPLVSALGVGCAILGREFGGLVVAASFLALAALIVASTTAIMRRDADPDPGVTTETALIVMFGVGLLLGVGHTALAVVLGASTAVLLHLKPQLHGFAARLGDTDMRAVMQFAAIALVILPVLPDTYYGPFKVLNPHRIWWMVVLITGISLAGYVAQKLLGRQGGSLVAGLLGGLVSSTATTVSYARRSRAAGDGQGAGDGAAVVIPLASAVVFVRVLAVIGATVPGHFRAMAPPITVMLVVLLALSAHAWWRSRGDSVAASTTTNPTELTSAVVFTALFAGVLLAVAAAREYLGNRGMFAVAAVSGLTDMDAITLSTGQMLNGARVGADLAWRLVVVASMANLCFKAGTVWMLGDRVLAREVAIRFAIAFGCGVALLLLWP